MGVARHTPGTLLLDGTPEDDFYNYLYYLLYWPTLSIQTKRRRLWNRVLYWLIKISREESALHHDMELYIREAIKREYIERLPHRHLQMGKRGMSVYVWYYPLLQFFSATFANTNLKSIAVAALLFFIFDLLYKYIL